MEEQNIHSTRLKGGALVFKKFVKTLEYSCLFEKKVIYLQYQLIKNNKYVAYYLRTFNLGTYELHGIYTE
jgi:hypothetical protein